MSNRICAVKLIEFPDYEVRQDETGGKLVVYEGNAEVPFNIARVFQVQATAGATRGRHAHKKCIQLMICSTGCIRITCDDGIEKIAYTLDRPNVGILVPEGIWAEQTYAKPDSVLTVLCNRTYEESDYIREYKEFLAYRQLKEQE